MDKSNLELFKQALNEAVSNKFDKMADECTEEIVYSEKHKLAMRTIIYGKTDTKRVLSPKMKRIIAILIAVALLLTSCGIIFRNEIREIFEEFCVKLTYDATEESNKSIKEVYTLSYLPEGYFIENERVTSVRVQYEYTNENKETLFFEQCALGRSEFVVDSESGYSKIEDIVNYEIYYRNVNGMNCYISNDGKYIITFITSEKLTTEHIILILDGITTK